MRDTISRQDALAAIEAIPPEWARKGSMAKFNQVTIEQATKAINALPAADARAVVIEECAAWIESYGPSDTIGNNEAATAIRALAE